MGPGSRDFVKFNENSWNFRKTTAKVDDFDDQNLKIDVKKIAQFPEIPIPGGFQKKI